MTGSRIALTLGVVGVVAALAWHGLRPLSDTDLWWHMRLGERMLQTGSLVDTDPFSFSYPDAPWPYKDAGSAVVLYGLWSLGGAPALVLAKAAMLGATAGLLWHWLRRLRQVPVALALLVTALAIEGISFRFTERAASMSLLILVGALVLIERHRLGRGRLWWLVPLTILNANLHRAAIVLPVIATAYAVVRFVEARRDRHADADLRTPILVAIGCGLACLATPFGWALVSTTWGLMGQHSALLTEWTPLSWDLVAHLTPATFVVGATVGLGAGLSLWRTRPIDLWDLALVAMAFGLGLGSLRHLPYLALLGAAPAAAGLATLSAWSGRLAPTIAAATGITAFAAAWSSPLASPSLGLAPGHFPERGIAFVKEQAERGTAIVGNPFNEFGYGGFVVFHLWPQYRVYIDGRTDLVYPPEHVERYVQALHDPRAFEAEAARLRIEWVLLDNVPMDGARAHFDANPRWVLVFASQRSLIYVRADGPNAPLAREAGYRVLWAHDLPGSVQAAAQRGELPQALAELRRMHDQDPANPWVGEVLSRLRSSSP
jgi:hypothetical protein